MNETKWTPGPWRIKGNFILRDEPEVESTIGMAVSCICELHANHNANARLIAKAPEMFEALKLAVQVMQDNNIDEAMAGEFYMFTDLLSSIHNGGEM